MSKMIDLTGQNFGRLIAIKSMGKNKCGNYKWLCKCECGNEKIIQGARLRNGQTQSCGCLWIEKITKHEHRKDKQTSKTYQSWKHMIQRCTNFNDKEYKNYGGRGIVVDEQWMKFENFLKDMGESSIEKYMIDRIDNNKGYYKENCRWVTSRQSARNRRSNHLITHNGKIQCLKDWSEETGISEQVIIWRLNNSWSIKKTLTTPVRYQLKRGI